MSLKRSHPDADRFDCQKLILSQLERHRGEFDHVVLSTWKGQVTPHFVDALRSEGVEVVEPADPGRPDDYRGPVSDNRLRQYVSAYAGIAAHRAAGFEHALWCKVRTDHELDWTYLASTAEHALYALPVQGCSSGRLFVPYLLSKELWSVGDFYLAGDLAEMDAFFTTLVELYPVPCGAPSVHVDIPQKFQWHHSARRHGAAESAFPVVPAGRTLRSNTLLGFPARQLDEWCSFVEEHLCIGPQRLLLDSTLRDEKLSDTGPYFRRQLYSESRSQGSPPLCDQFDSSLKSQLRLNGVPAILDHWLFHAPESHWEIKAGRRLRRAQAIRYSRWLSQQQPSRLYARVRSFLKAEP